MAASVAGATGGLAGATAAAATAASTAATVGSLASKAWMLNAGLFAGTMAAGYLFPGENAPDSFDRAPQLSDSQIIQAAYGARLTKLYGSARVAATVLWFGEKINIQTFKDNPGGGGFLSFLGGGASIKTKNYFADLALGFCEGPAEISELYVNATKIWETGEPLVNDNFTLKLYDGTESQTADSDMTSLLGETPPFRGVCYCVFKGINLTRLSANMMPNFRAVVTAL